MDLLRHTTCHAQFLAIYFDPNLRESGKTIFYLICFLSMTISTKFMELIGVLQSYFFSIKYYAFVLERDWH